MLSLHCFDFRDLLMKLGVLLKNKQQMKRSYLNQVVFNGKFYQIDNGFKIEFLHDMILM
jgi:hypothetical protein